MSNRYKPDANRDALAFDILQNMPQSVAQAFFWNFRSREQRREAILAWKADQEMNSESPAHERQFWERGL